MSRREAAPSESSPLDLPSSPAASTTMAPIRLSSRPYLSPQRKSESATPTNSTAQTRTYVSTSSSESQLFPATFLASDASLLFSTASNSSATTCRLCCAILRTGTWREPSERSKNGTASRIRRWSSFSAMSSGHSLQSSKKRTTTAPWTCVGRRSAYRGGRAVKKACVQELEPRLDERGCANKVGMRMRGGEARDGPRSRPC